MSRPTILIVDDDEALRETLAVRLRPGYQVLQAATGTQGLEILRLVPVGIVLVDQFMPGMSGLEFLRLARARHPDLGLVMLTGQICADLVGRAMGEGEAHRVLFKPVDLAELEVTLLLVRDLVRLERDRRHLRSLAAFHPWLAQALDRDQPERRAGRVA
jgi:two-component system, probable response regulator PhcQ